MSCSPLAAAHPTLAAAKGEQGKAKNKAVKPFANRSRRDSQGRCSSHQKASLLAKRHAL